MDASHASNVSQFENNSRDDIIVTSGANCNGYFFRSYDSVLGEFFSVFGTMNVLRTSCHDIQEVASSSKMSDFKGALF